MPFSLSPLAHAGRAVVEDIRRDKVGWLHHGLAALAVSVLGLAVAGSVTLTGAAQSTSTAATAQSRTAAAAGAERTAGTSRNGGDRPALDAARVKSLADQRAEELGKLDATVKETATEKAVEARDNALRSAVASTRRERKAIVEGKKTDTSPAVAAPGAPAASGGKGCSPVAGGYSIAARFGQVGMWARYHTGFDFSAPVGTPLRAAAAGVVTNAGIGPASGWAGNYVAIRHSDGTQTLMAHMSNVSVSVGQTVSGCQLVGAVGMTGRTFGPHVHFEVYPAGVTPGDVYRAVNPLPWLHAHGVNP